MKTIAVVSPVGGAGRTTLVALLAGLLATRGHPMLAVECDPRNVLALHFGLHEPACAGLASYLTGTQVVNAALRSDDNVLLLPWGAHDDPAAIAVRLHAEPGWLAALLARVELPDGTLAVIDTPTWPSVETDQAITAADFVLAVLSPSPTTCAALPRLRNALAGKPCAYVVNGVTPAHALHVDVIALLRATLGNAMLPYQIYADTGVPEALARSENFCTSMPGSQAAHDLQGLAAWLSRWANAAEAP